MRRAGKHLQNNHRGRTDEGVALPDLTLGSVDLTDNFSGLNFDGETSGSGFSGKWVGNSAATVQARPNTPVPWPETLA